MGDTAYIEKIWDFLELGRNRLEALASAMETGDTVAIRSCSQDLRIKADGLGLGDVARSAKAVEAGAYNCCLTYTLTSYNELSSKLDGLKKELAKVPEAG